MEKKEEKTSSFLWGIGGIILFLLGISLLGYTGYKVFSKTNSQKISEILPIQDLDFVVFYSGDEKLQNNTSKEKKLLKNMFFPVFSGNKNAVISIYSSQEVVVITEKDSENNTTKKKTTAKKTTTTRKKDE